MCKQKHFIYRAQTHIEPNQTKHHRFKSLEFCSLLLSFFCLFVYFYSVNRVFMTWALLHAHSRNSITLIECFFALLIFSPLCVYVVPFIFNIHHTVMVGPEIFTMKNLCIYLHNIAATTTIKIELTTTLEFCTFAAPNGFEYIMFKNMIYSLITLREMFTYWWI